MRGAAERGLGRGCRASQVVVHDYQRIDFSRIWTIVETDLPPLVNALTAYLGNVD